MNAGEEREFQQRLERLDALVVDLEPESDSRQVAELLLELHGAAFARLTERLKRSGGAGASILSECAADPLIGSLMILHGLHPDDLGTRVRRALDLAQPALQLHGMGARLVSVLDGAAHVRVEAGDDCDAHSADEVRAAIEAAIAENAPDLSHVEISGLPESARRRPTVALPLVTAT